MRALKDFSVDYDREADALYIDIGTPKPSDCEPAGSGLVFVRRDRETGEVVGLAVMDFSYVKETGFFDNVDLPEPFSKETIKQLLNKLC